MSRAAPVEQLQRMRCSCSTYLLALHSCDTVHKAQEEITPVRVVSAGKRWACAGCWQTGESVLICRTNQLTQAQLWSTAHRRGETESTKHRNQVQLGQTKSEQNLPRKRRHESIRMLNSSARAAFKTAGKRRSRAAQQQQRGKRKERSGRRSRNRVGVDGERRAVPDHGTTRRKPREKRTKSHPWSPVEMECGRT